MATRKVFRKRRGTRRVRRGGLHSTGTSGNSWLKKTMKKFTKELYDKNLKPEQREKLWNEHKERFKKGFGDFKEGVGKFKKQMLGHKSSQNLENVYDENQRFSDINPINDDVDISSTYNERGSKEKPKETVFGRMFTTQAIGRSPKFVIPGNNQAKNRNTTRKTGTVINLGKEKQL